MRSTSITPIQFDNSYQRLPDRFYARQHPTPVRGPKLLRLNERLAADLGLDPEWLRSAEGVAMMAGNHVPEGASPIAQAYAGHQFGGFSPQLGDGRAVLLGEVVTPAGERRDIQLKGSGRTPYSRMGDGRAPLGPVLREYIVSEAMAALGLPTTRALAAVASGEPVVREAVMPGAVLTRVAASHIRVGTFQFFAARRDIDGLRALADHVIDRHDPDLAGTDDPYRGMLDRVIERQARLIARWMGIGFIHGVMNTDNMTISGETIDFGPCAFMDAYDPATVYSSIDHQGRYAYRNQPAIAQWNLVRLAEAMLPILAGDDDDARLANAQAAIDRFPGLYDEALTDVFRAKLGLTTREPGDKALQEALLSVMADAGADFTNTFRALSTGEPVPAGLAGWMQDWTARLAREGATPADRQVDMQAANPAYIPRNHLVEEAISAGLDGDLGPFDRLMAVLAQPYRQQADAARHALPPAPDEIVAATFCGT